MFQPVTDRNLEIAAQIHAASWKESHRAFVSPAFVRAHTTARQMEYIRSEMRLGKAFYLLMLDSPKGIVSVRDDLIENLYVLPSEQRKGYGTMLLHYAESLCSGRPRLWVLSNNQGAISFYQRSGYLFTGTRNRLNDTLEELEMELKHGAPGDNIICTKRPTCIQTLPFPQFSK